MGLLFKGESTLCVYLRGYRFGKIPELKEPICISHSILPVQCLQDAKKPSVLGKRNTMIGDETFNLEELFPRQGSGIDPDIGYGDDIMLVDHSPGKPFPGLNLSED